MDLLSALRTNQLEKFKAEFTWKTRDGVTKRIPEMDTVHLFNTAKLIINKFNDAQKRDMYTRGPRGGYNCTRKNGQTFFFMVWEIEQRDNLDQKYRMTYNNMLSSVFDHQFIYQDLPRAIRPQVRPEHQPRTGSFFDRVASMFGPNREEPTTVAQPGRPLTAEGIEQARNFLNSGGVTTEQARQSLQEFGRTFVGIDYGDMEARVMGRFVTDEPEATLDMRNLGTMHLSTQMMREHLRPHMREGTLDATQWLSFVPEPFRERAAAVFQTIVARHIARFSRQDPQTLEQIIAEFQQEKRSAILAGELTNRGWTVRTGRSTAEREEERLGTRVFTPEHMFETINQGSTGPHVDLTLWLMTIPEHFREGVDWVVHYRILRRLGNLRLNRRMINTFIQHFQDFKTSALQAGDLTRSGWVTPARERSPAEQERVRQEDERRGRGRRMGIDYLQLMFDTMGPQHFENQLIPLLQRNPGNRPLIEEFRNRNRQRESEAQRRNRMAELTNGRSEGRNRNPILFFDTESGGLNGLRPNQIIVDEVVPEAPKDPQQQVEQLTTFGKRKITLDDGENT